MRARIKALETYWRTAAERQQIFYKKIKGESVITEDPIFLKYKFCNVYRGADRVSQFLIKNVIYDRNRSGSDTLFRVFLFRLLNKIETWKILEEKLGEIKISGFDVQKYSKILKEIKADKKPIYGNAFILCANKAFGFEEKHENHLALMKYIIQNNLTEEWLDSKNMSKLFYRLRELPLIGNFMAYQIAIDFNYSPVFNFDENEFTMAGPGAIRGINKCFEDKGGKSYEQIIDWMVENQNEEFKRLGINFLDLWGRPMKAIDVQNWFCETDKYLRVSMPELKSNRGKIKTGYKQNNKKIHYFFPPKWGINAS